MCQELVGLVGESVLGAVVGDVDPPDRAWVSYGGELVEHGEHGSDTDPRGDEDDRAGAFFEYERSAGLAMSTRSPRWSLAWI